jgi:formylglycine-generating enzyme required for sulfatase activity
MGVAAVLGVVVLTAVAVPAVRRTVSRREHTQRGEVQLLVYAPDAARVRLLRSGRALDDASPAPMPAPAMWLQPDDYFVEITGPQVPAFFPIPLRGLRRGPDAGGSFAVVMRSDAVDRPPDVGSSFVFVPAGHSVIGDRRNPGEPHFVWVGAFFIGAFEVTNAELRRFLDAPDGYHDERSWTPDGWRWKTSRASSASAWMRPGDPDYARFGRDELPVVLVTWYEAHAYARWLTRTRGGGRWVFRLPTEAEWEKAARGPDAFEYGLGMELSEREAPLYNWRKNPEAAVTLVDVGTSRREYRPNRYGLFHASGNAAEWTQSVIRPYNADRPYRDDERNADGAPGMRVTRGGSWYSATTVRLHLAYRDEFLPTVSSSDLGFRIVAVRLPVR